MLEPIVAIDKRTNKLRLISEFATDETGLRCNCRCFECGGDLEAVINTTRRKHFRHSNKACNASYETQLHFLAKYIIVNSSYLKLPELGIVRYDNAKAELETLSYRPDVTIQTPERTIYIEILVTSEISSAKRQFYESETAFACEIDLSDIHRKISIEDLREIVLNGTNNKYILHYSNRNVEGVKHYSISAFEGFAIAAFAGYGIYQIAQLAKRKPHRRRRN